MSERERKYIQFLAPILITFGILFIVDPLSSAINEIEKMFPILPCVLFVIGLIALGLGIYVGISSITNCKRS